ncbi:uncharacterized protein LACBIDRAFT_333458 [Laccaria bicolor S238N-H82]|uniref:Predicted protein n=1 Tax=Laccaria bicolor (strain S238N-H82 / ATCC MYA-4686) TaxID=486041 RepID=B0DVZ5_LACBS|nr:uncharacterized protein LACBIDRAFT_333458 [Laccaria bicolor S238N-H82]EDR01258.1 predicted protein [Laccaria bicolor S238N-H82]|eukprot:XP_001888134.1 predicted protein [Laccaria bicolor S238N-H82]
MNLINVDILDHHHYHLQQICSPECGHSITFRSWDRQQLDDPIRCVNGRVKLASSLGLDSRTSNSADDGSGMSIEGRNVWGRVKFQGQCCTPALLSLTTCLAGHPVPLKSLADAYGHRP